MDDKIPIIDDSKKEISKTYIPVDVKVKKKKVEWLEREHKGKKEEFAIRRSWDGWRVVYPMKNQDGTMNWKNIILGGGWGKLINWIMILLILLAFFYVYDHDTKICRDSLSHLDLTCAKYTEMLRINASNSNAQAQPFNFTVPSSLNTNTQKPDG